MVIIIIIIIFIFMTYFNCLLERFRVNWSFWRLSLVNFLFFTAPLAGLLPYWMLTFLPPVDKVVLAPDLGLLLTPLSSKMSTRASLVVLSLDLRDMVLIIPRVFALVTDLLHLWDLPFPIKEPHLSHLLECPGFLSLIFTGCS